MLGSSPAPQPPEKPPSALSWPGKSTPKSSRSIPWHSIAAWISARPSRSPAEQRLVPHHLIDILDPSEEFSVAQYLAAASAAAQEITQRGKRVLFVGGTALYLKALLRGLFDGPTANWKLRRELEEVARIEGPGALHQRLQQVDPAAAMKLHPNDIRRIIRALEVHQTTGQTISSFQQQFNQARPADQCRVFVLDWPREQLDERIRHRVDAMFSAGLIEEVKLLISAAQGHPPTTILAAPPAKLSATKRC